jgi:hypothetical protein
LVLQGRTHRSIAAVSTLANKPFEAVEITLDRTEITIRATDGASHMTYRAVGVGDGGAWLPMTFNGRAVKSAFGGTEGREVEVVDGVLMVRWVKSGEWRRLTVLEDERVPEIGRVRECGWTSMHSLGRAATERMVKALPLEVEWMDPTPVMVAVVGGMVPGLRWWDRGEGWSWECVQACAVRMQ